MQYYILEHYTWGKVNGKGLGIFHRFKPNSPIELALLSTIPDHNVLLALKAIHKSQQDLPRVLSTTQNAHQERYVNTY